MDSLPTIPTPPAQRLREFRIQVLPMITFCAAVAGVVLMWQRYVMPSNVVGSVEAIHANVISTLPGTVQSLNVERFQLVTNGQVIAQLLTITPEVLKATIEAMKADLKVNQARMITDEDRNRIQYENVRLSLLGEKVQFAIDKVNLKLARVEFKRADELFHAQPIALISEDLYDIAKAKLEVLEVTVADKTKYLAEKERTVPTLRPTTTNSLSVLDAIEAEERKLIAIDQPTVLTSPIDGMVTAINTRPGEKVVPGLPLVVISGTQGKRIVAYARQPMTVRPQVGDTVQVRRMSFKRELDVATVTVVGTQMEPVDPVLLPMANARIPEVGLPFSITVPPSLNLIPGETVDVILNPRGRK